MGQDFLSNFFQTEVLSFLKSELPGGGGMEISAGFVFQQDVDQLGVVGAHRVVERGVTGAGAAVGYSALAEQELGYVVGAGQGGHQQRRLKVLVLLVDGGASLQQGLDDPHEPRSFARRDSAGTFAQGHQRRDALAALGVGFDVGQRQQVFADGDVSLGGGSQQGGELPGVAGVGVGAVGQQQGQHGQGVGGRRVAGDVQRVLTEFVRRVGRHSYFQQGLGIFIGVVADCVVQHVGGDGRCSGCCLPTPRAR